MSTFQTYQDLTLIVFFSIGVFTSSFIATSIMYEMIW